LQIYKEEQRPEEAHGVARPRKKLKELHSFTFSYDVIVNNPEYSFIVI
jgi:hypothetical protein